MFKIEMECQIHSSDSHHAFIRESSDSHQAVIRQSSLYIQYWVALNYTVHYTTYITVTSRYTEALKLQEKKPNSMYNSTNTNNRNLSKYTAWQTWPQMPLNLNTNWLLFNHESLDYISMLYQNFWLFSNPVQIIVSWRHSVAWIYQ